LGMHDMMQIPLIT